MYYVNKSWYLLLYYWAWWVTFKKHLVSPPSFWCDPCCSPFLVFCVVLLCVFAFWVPCCDARCDFCMETMFGSSLPPVVCRKAHVLFMLLVFVCTQWCLTHIVLCLCFVVHRLVYQMLPVSLNCPFLIAPSVFSNIYFMCMIYNRLFIFQWVIVV